MAGPFWPPSRFWQYWAIIGMVVLTAAFWWGVEGTTIFRTARPQNEMIDGLLRFSLVALTPALVIVWLAAAWLRRRLGDNGYWQILGAVAMIWAAAILLIRILWA
ncbi:hypothetical protein [Sphingopyxis sp. MWB1]|uniref:hypothetical protein n=1 Tax=Sphingopyxis sp. MWB1 TaxID=1537715 RepID=UPI00051A5B6B|nr:hypothetical protein [Sphingopyxis sp. MWB1]